MQAPSLEYATLPATLLTLDELKTHLAQPFSVDDNLLDLQGQAVTQMMRDYCDQALNQVTITATFYDVETPRIRLPNAPVDSVTSVTADGATVDNIVFNKASGRLWSKTRELYADELVVVYTAGHLVIPASLADVYARLVKSRADAEGAEAGAEGTVKSLTVFGSHQIQYSDEGSVSPGGGAGEMDFYKEIIDAYVNPDRIVT